MHSKHGTKVKSNIGTVPMLNEHSITFIKNVNWRRQDNPIHGKDHKVEIVTTGGVSKTPNLIHKMEKKRG